MLKYPNKILYIGTGCNIEPVKHFLQTKEFIFVDSQPRIKNENLHLETTFNKKKYVSDFVNNLLLTCVFNGFGWKGFSKMNLWKQDKGQRACAAAFVRAVNDGGAPPIPLQEIIEVARVSIEIAESNK